MSEDPRNLIPLYTDDTSCRVVFIGGPGDGKSMVWTDPPPAILRLPVEQPVSALLDSLDEPYRGLPIADYEPILDNVGFRSRTDDGAYRYRYRGQH